MKTAALGLLLIAIVGGGAWFLFFRKSAATGRPVAAPVLPPQQGTKAIIASAADAGRTHVTVQELRDRGAQLHPALDPGQVFRTSGKKPCKKLFGICR